MSIQITHATLTSDETLHELIIQSLDNLLGPGNQLIAPQLPFDGNHILAIDKNHKPAVISYDNKDGGKALLSGIAAAEKLVASRALLYRLYPRLTEIASLKEDDLTMENIRLILLVPQLLCGAHYLTRSLSNILVFTYHALQVNNDIGLWIVPGSQKTNGIKPSITSSLSPTPVFRTGRFNLSDAEELFFQEM